MTSGGATIATIAAPVKQPSPSIVQTKIATEQSTGKFLREQNNKFIHVIKHEYVQCIL